MSTKARALQTTASTTIEATTFPDGQAAGHDLATSTTGTYTIAVPARETAVTPTPGSCGIQRERIAGPTAYPITTNAICPTATRFEPATSRPTSAATPSMPRAMPHQFTGVRWAGRPMAKATATPASGTAASRSPAVELGSVCSAELRKYQGMTISQIVYATIGFPDAQHWSHLASDE